MSKKMLPIYDLDDLQEIFDYPNRRSINRALRTGALPIKMFLLRNRRVCHVAVVEKYFENMKKEGLEALEEADWDSLTGLSSSLPYVPQQLGCYLLDGLVGGVSDDGPEAP